MLSIVIPTHQRWDLLHRCLIAVTQHLPSGTEVIVVDDGSPGDQVTRVVRSFPTVSQIRLPRRQGFAVAANTGIRSSQGDIVELLNDDTEVQAGWADHPLTWFADPTIAAVAPLVLYWPDGKRIDSAGDRYYLGGIAGKRGHGCAMQSVFLQPAQVFGASASSAFFRRSALEKVGLFPESFGGYFEDIDLAFRLQRAGYRAMYEPRSQVLHRVSASYGTKGRQLLEQQSCNEERVFWRNLPAACLCRAIPLHVGVLLGKAWRRWQEGTLAPFLLGRLRLLGEIPTIFRHRRWLKHLGPDRDWPKWQVESSFWERHSYP